MLLLFWRSGSVPPDPTEDTRQPGAGGSRKRRRQIIFKDGRRAEARTEAEFKRLVRELLAEAEVREFTKPKAPKKRKPVQKPGSVDPYVIAKADNISLWSALMAELEELSQQALTQEAILRLARVVIAQQMEEEEAVLMLLIA